MPKLTRIRLKGLIEMKYKRNYSEEMFSGKKFQSIYFLNHSHWLTHTRRLVQTKYSYPKRRLKKMCGILLAISMFSGEVNEHIFLHTYEKVIHHSFSFFCKLLYYYYFLRFFFLEQIKYSESVEFDKARDNCQSLSKLKTHRAEIFFVTLLFRTQHSLRSEKYWIEEAARKRKNLYRFFSPFFSHCVHSIPIRNITLY